MTVDQLPPSPPPARLKTPELLRAGIAALTERQLGDLIAVAGIWTIVLAVVQFLVLVSTPPAGGLGEEIAQPPQTGLTDLLYTVVTLIAFVDIAVKWIRLLVLDEMPQGFSDPRLNRRRWSFLLRSLLLLAVTIALVLVLSIVAALFGMGALGAGVLAIPFTLVAMFVLAYFLGGRLGLYLVGAALGDSRMSFGASWDATREDGMAIALAVLVATLIFFIPSTILLMLAGLFSALFTTTVAALLLAPMLAVLNVAGYLVYEAILARAYGRLVPEPPPGTLVL